MADSATPATRVAAAIATAVRPPISRDHAHHTTAGISATVATATGL